MLKLDFFKKLKLFKFQEPTPGIIGFFLLSLCLIFYFLMLDCRILNGLRGHILSTSSSSSSNSMDSSAETVIKLGFLELEKGACNLYEGNWVWDESYPLYKSQDCAFLDLGFRCTENGRPDNFYSKWRWQPKDCDLPRFDAKAMLEKMRNRRIVFVGDSIGRNQWESLLCLLSSVIEDKKCIYEVNGTPITKHMGSFAFFFRDFNCTVEYYRSPFLVLQSRAPKGSPENVKMTLKLDQMDWSSRQWKNADLLIINTGHWWNYEKTVRGGCYFQEGETIKPEMSVEDALRSSIETLSKWISSEVNLSRTHLIFRGYAPVHFRGGDWNSGGGCHLETIPDRRLVSSERYVEYRRVVDGLGKHIEKGNVEFMNVTGMTSQRKDAHASLYYLGSKIGLAPIHRQDCSHWCLPGVPDIWNEILYALAMKRWSYEGFEVNV